MHDAVFGKYRLLKRLGRGGMADVYLARDTATGRDVALKLVEVREDRESREVCDAERRGAILQEQFCRVDSHVPTVHAYGTECEHFYLDMEYVDGEDVAAIVARGPLPAADAAAIALEIARFLEKAHQFDAVVDGQQVHCIIHGDIKPKNVRLNRNGQVKVLDFGIAKGLSLVRELTRNDFRSSTYSSPERLDSGDVDVQADLWSVGVVLYEMLAGRPPFQAETVEKLERRIQAREPAPPLPDTVPPGLQRVVFKALAPSRGRRYETAGDFAADIASWMAGHETRADLEWMHSVSVAEETRRTAPVRDVAEAGGNGDPDATRRTVGERTRPTVGPEQTRAGAGAAAGLAAATTAPATAPALPGRRQPFLTRRERRLAIAGLAALLFIVFANEVSVWSAARELRSGLPALQPSQLDAAWRRYEALDERSLLRFGLVGLRRPLRERLVAHADRVISDYRHDAPAVREAQWQEASAWLAKASRLDPGNSSLTARLRYCEGHLYRIEGEAKKRRKQASADTLHQAVMRFEEAGRLDRQWPDPYLGLGRTYIYGLEDLDRAIAAFEEAGKRGFRPGLREIAQLADGYRNRGERMRREAANLRGLPQEVDLLLKAANDYRRSLVLYQQAAGFGEASANVRQVQRRLDEVSGRLEKLQDG
ncbi:MAG: protein kinase [Vicinamibacterales bacterium]